MGKAKGVAEALLELASAAAAEPVSGLAGIVDTLVNDSSSGAKTVEEIQEMLTYSPKSDEGKEMSANISETLAPVGEALSETEKALGEAVFEATGSEELAAMAHTLPTATLAALGLKGSTKAAKKSPKKSPKKPEVVKESKYGKFGYNHEPSAYNPNLSPERNAGRIAQYADRSRGYWDDGMGHPDSLSDAIVELLHDNPEVGPLLLSKMKGKSPTSQRFREMVKESLDYNEKHITDVDGNVHEVNAPVKKGEDTNVRISLEGKATESKKYKWEPENLGDFKWNPEDKPKK